MTIGRIVHYRLSEGPSQGELRPAIVVRVEPDDVVNLLVFVDGLNDGTHVAPLWVQAVTEGQGEGQWCWPSREPEGPPS